MSKLKTVLILMLSVMVFSSCGKSNLSQIVDTIEAGEEYNPMHFVVSKDDSSIALKKDNININKPGTYKILYELTSETLKYSESEIEVKVVDTTPPEFESDKVTTNLNGEFDITKSLKATDKADGDVSSEIKVLKGNVDVKTVGEYVITVEVSDSSKNLATKEVTVSVLDTEKVLRAENQYKAAKEALLKNLTYPDSLVVKSAAVCNPPQKYDALVMLTCNLKNSGGKDAQNDFYIGIINDLVADSQFSAQAQQDNSALWSEDNAISIEIK